MTEQVTEEAEGMAFFQGQGGLHTRPDDAGRKRGRERIDILLVGACQFDQASKVVHARVECGDVGES